MDNWNKGREDVYEIDTKELLDHIRSLDYFDNTFGPSLKMVADFSPESLEHLEFRLARFSENFRKNPKVEVVLLLGYYFGETLVRNVPGAHWYEERIHDIRNFSIRIQQSNGYQELKPVARILNLFMDPKRFPLSTVYETLMAMVNGEVDVMNAPDEQRTFYDKNGEYLFRIKHVATFPAEGCKSNERK